MESGVQYSGNQRAIFDGENNHNFSNISEGGTMQQIAHIENFFFSGENQKKKNESEVISNEEMMRRYIQMLQMEIKELLSDKRMLEKNNQMISKFNEYLESDLSLKNEKIIELEAENKRLKQGKKFIGLVFVALIYKVFIISTNQHLTLLFS